MKRGVVLPMLSVALIICATWQVPATNAANILGIFTSHSPSHLIVHMSLAKALAEKGHNITVVVTTEPKVNHKNINVIRIPPTKEQEQILTEEVAEMAAKKTSMLQTFKKLLGSLSLFIDIQADAMKDPKFATLYDENLYKFDLVICGYFMNDFQFGVAAKLKVPLIVSWSAQAMGIINDFAGNPVESSYVPATMMPVSLEAKSMSFLERLQNLVMNTFFDVFLKIINYRMNQYYINLFPNDESFPTMSDMHKNISLVFANGHFSEGPVRPNVPALIEIGGIQVKDKPQPLPKDIDEFLSASKDTGAILFSLGSNLKGSSIKQKTAEIIFNVLSKLKQKVIWKWEDLEHTPGKSPNIMYKKWMPQDDILAHPNIKLFITHAGKGGIIESQYHGVPMVALPVFGDQHSNAGKMVQLGYGQSLELTALDEKSLNSAISEVLSNPIYKHNVQQFSRLYRDRPQSARDSVVYWTEYVLRHHGAAHMQSPLVHMNFIQANNLDVFALMALLIYTIYRLFKLLFKFICSKCSKKNLNIKSKKLKKQ